MTCDRCRSLADDYVDAALGADDRRAVEAHLVTCDACRTLVADLNEIRRSARSLEQHVPPPQVWTKLAAALEAESPRRRFRLRRFAASARQGDWVAWRPIAVAATLVLLLGATWIVLRSVPSPTDPMRSAAGPAAADPELTQSVETELKLAEEHYQKAIAGLEQITRSESTALDPQVAAVLQKNLEVIDHAIGESRAALQSQPTNGVAQESLFEALRNKVTLLQDTVVLINEMRKGNPEGTARAVSGLNQ